MTPVRTSMALAVNARVNSLETVMSAPGAST
jgi:hypothetical protein